MTYLNLKHSLSKCYCFVVVLLPGCGDDKAAMKSSVAPPVMAIGSARPMLEVVAGDGQLGAVDFGEKKTCTFRLRNNQPQSMTLRLVDKSCTCAGVQVPTEPVAPGQEATVTLTWSPKAEVLESSSVRLWAEVADTQGKNRQRLEAVGTIEPKVMVAYPRGPLDFGKITPGDLEHEQTRLVVEVYSKQQAFEAPLCNLNVPGLVVASSEPLTADRLSLLQAKGGYRLTIRPSKELAHGTIQGQLAIQTAIKPAPLVVDIAGSLDTTAISLSQDRLQLPPRLSLTSGYRIPALTLTSRFGNCTKCEVLSVTPKLFDTKVSQVNEKTWKLEVMLSKDIAQMQQRFSSQDWQQLMDFGFEQGSITLRLDHPDVKTLTIPITGTQLSRE